MKNIEALKTCNTLYSVDPERLSIKECSSFQLKNQHCYTRTYENFSLNEDHKSSDLPSMDQLPIKINGVMYFKTEEEAKFFIKTIIGL